VFTRGQTYLKILFITMFEVPAQLHHEQFVPSNYSATGWLTNIIINILDAGKKLGAA
jgi:hypothetical protein